MDDAYSNIEVIDASLSDTVASCVCEVIGVPKVLMFDKTRDKKIVLARRIYFYEMVRVFGVATKALERHHHGGSGVDHANILHHVRVCREEMMLYPKIKEIIVNVELLINNALLAQANKNEIKKGGKSWIITRKNHRHNSYLSRRMK